jgi:hypothetical protein
MKFLPKKFTPAYLYSENISNILNKTSLPSYTKYPKHTLLAKIIELQSKNFFKSIIE